MTKQSNNPPVDHVRLGAVQAAIWRNIDSEGRARYDVTVEKRYRDDAGEWHSTNSFGRDDLPLLSKVTDIAHTRVFELIGRDRGKESTNSSIRAKAVSR
mgnify:CR=1 FL=1|jgi:hypothetical protein